MVLKTFELREPSNPCSIATEKRQIFAITANVGIFVPYLFIEHNLPALYW